MQTILLHARRFKLSKLLKLSKDKTLEQSLLTAKDIWFKWDLPNDSYLQLIFGKFALIWDHFQNVSVCRFWGRWGLQGQKTSKFKTTSILNKNLLKLDEIQN